MKTFTLKAAIGGHLLSNVGLAGPEELCSKVYREGLLGFDKEAMPT